MKLNLLTLSNPKTRKGEKHGYLTAILHLAPNDVSGQNVCPKSTPGCRDSCLNTAGRGGLARKDGRNTIQEARLTRTLLYLNHRDAFMRLLDMDISKVVSKAYAEGMIPAIRLNGTSDIVWEKIRNPLNGLTIFEMWPGVQFYDYTKIPGRKPPANYHLTFSLSESNIVEAVDEFYAGKNVAVVFHTVPETWGGETVIDGDQSDLRFLDPQFCIIGLKAKGKAKKDQTGFVL